MKPIGLLIHHLHLLHRQKLNIVFQELGLTSSQAFTLIQVLKAYKKQQLICQKDIEQAMEISNPTVTGILNRLEQKELIKRVPGKHDARVRNIIVTEKALELDKELRRKFSEVENDVVSCFNEEEVQLFHQMLDRIVSTHDETVDDLNFCKGDE